MLKRLKMQKTRGTRIIIYNLSQEKVVDMNNKGVLRYELDTTTDPYDILIAESKCVPKRSRGQQTSDDAPRCDFSLRAYCSVLYLNPKIKIYLKTKKVRTVLIAKSLKETEKDVYRPWEENQRVRITFGFNPNEHPYGVCFYHNNRLIKSYQRLGYQKNADNRGFGIVGIIDCNFLTPTHNKQDFKDSTAHSRCIKAVGDKLNDYWNEKRENVEAARTTHQFLGSTKDDLPDHTWVQCDYCSKWRKLPDSVSNDSLPDLWSCSMNKDLARRDCNVPQEPENSDDEISKPTYDKSYKKREAKKKLEQKITKSLQQKEKNHENQKNEEIIKDLKEQLAKTENKNAQKEVNKPHEIEQDSTYCVLLNLKKELLNQKEQLDTCVMDVEKAENAENNGENTDPPPVKKIKVKPSQESELHEQKPHTNKPSEYIADDKIQVVSTTRAVQTVNFGDSERKLTNLRSHVIKLLKSVVNEEEFQELINDLEGDKIDEVLQEVMENRD